MQVTHAGYKDPNNLMFDSITILGVSDVIVSVSVTHVSNGTNSGATILPRANVQHNESKQVNTHAQHIIVHNCKKK